MCINKEMKSAVTRPTNAYLQKTSLYLNCRIKNFLRILFPERFKEPVDYLMICNGTSHVQHWEENIQKMCSFVESSELLSVEQKNRGLVNVFSGQVATPEQSKDMMIFRETGTVSYRQYISTRLLEVPSNSNSPSGIKSC